MACFFITLFSKEFFALVTGAAAMLAGVTRMTISLTVILCEISNDAFLSSLAASYHPLHSHFPSPLA